MDILLSVMAFFALLGLVDDLIGGKMAFVSAYLSTETYAPIVPTHSMTAFFK